MKKIVLIGIVVFLIGVAITLASLSALGWDFSKLNTELVLEKKQKTLENTNQDITIDDRNTKFQVLLSPDDKIHLEYYENESIKYNINLSGDIHFKKEIKRNWLHFFQNNFRTASFIIHLPKDYKGNLLIDTSNGEILVQDITLQHVDLATSNAKIQVERVHGATLSADTSNAKVWAKDLMIEGLCKVETSNGSIVLEKVSAGDLDAENANGKIEVEEVKVAKKVDLETSNSSIHLKNLYFGEAGDIETANGSIRGSIVGDMRDFTIVSETSNGSNNLPEKYTGGSRKLDVSTANGNISIEFTQ